MKKYYYPTNTYSQVHLHIVFATYQRMPLIPRVGKEKLYTLIGGIIKKKGHHPIAINGIEDHIHILLGFRPSDSIADLIRDIKAGSTKYMNETLYRGTRFSWQRGYSVFSYSKSQIDAVAAYIASQEEHHRKESSESEILRIHALFGWEMEPASNIPATSDESNSPSDFN